jgi:hypothetical protein
MPKEKSTTTRAKRATKTEGGRKKKGMYSRSLSTALSFVPSFC